MVQAEACLAPAAAYGFRGNAEHFGRFGVSELLVPDQIEDLAQVAGKPVDPSVELAPARQPGRIVGAVGNLVWRRIEIARAVGIRSRRGMIPSEPLGAKISSLEVEQLASDLL